MLCSYQSKPKVDFSDSLPILSLTRKAKGHPIAPGDNGLTRKAWRGYSNLICKFCYTVEAIQEDFLPMQRTLPTSPTLKRPF